uniref:Uncharacterized protein n=1 Tax=Magallana gigas TaxID=29159 RepID=A0A8W8JQI4_MAGGI
MVHHYLTYYGHGEEEVEFHFDNYSGQKKTTLFYGSKINRSSKDGHNIPQIFHDQDKPVVFYDWKTYLQNFVKPLKI